MRDIWIFVTGIAMMLVSTLLLSTYGNVSFHFVFSEPQWWALPLSLFAAAQSSALAMFAIVRGKRVRSRDASTAVHLFQIGLFGVFIGLPLLWVLVENVGGAAVILAAPYDLALSAVLVRILCALGVLE